MSSSVDKDIRRDLLLSFLSDPKFCPLQFQMLFGDAGVDGKGELELGCSGAKGPPRTAALAPRGPSPLVLFAPHLPRRLLEPMMRNTCFWAALVLRNTTKGRAKKRKKGRKEKSFGILSLHRQFPH